jgi:hypothetical protein
MAAPRIVLGVDFDNTLARYDAPFHRLARELGLIGPEIPAGKNAVRDHLRETGREDAWTEMQGIVYGPRMNEAQACPGAIATLTALTRAGVGMFIISHKTRTPYRGATHDLHAAARGWLEQNGFFDPAQVGLTPERVFFEPTKEAKLARIASVGCTHFVDDLPEILFHPAFPASVERILYDPDHAAIPPGPCQRLTHWEELPAKLRQL